MKLEGRIYKACVQTVMIYGSETWPMKVVDERRLERCENLMMRWMCRVSLRKRLPSVKLEASKMARHRECVGCSKAW